MDTLVARAKNSGDRPVPITHLGQMLTVPAGGERIVPWDAMTSLWGDPRWTDGRQGSRFNEAMRLRGQFGWFQGLNREDEWVTVRPPIEWETLDGERIWTVLDDPTGELASQAASPEPDVAPDTAFLLRQIEEMKRQVDQMQAAADQRTTAAAQVEETSVAADTGELPPPDPDEPVVTDDTPRGPRLRAGK